jgi:GT2 family glycosyltransferase
MQQSNTSQTVTTVVRALAVVVLYRTPFARSKTIQGLARAFAEDPTLPQQLDVLVWDNSPETREQQRGPSFICTYVHSNANQGVSGAYNAAIAAATERRCGWLLLLDDDTSVTGEFLHGMLSHAVEVKEEEPIAAIVPFLYAGTFCLSPRLWRFARHVPLPRPAITYTEKRSIFAANSGTLMRARALAAIGGYSSRFWLDYSDIDVFHRLHQHGFSVRIAGDLKLEHEMAMLDYDRQMTPGRFATFLAAESDFVDLYRGPAERGMHLLRLVARILHQRSYADPAFARLSCKALWERLTMRRATRLTRHERMRSAGADRG